MPYVWFAVICLIWGSSFTLMKRGTEFFSPIGVGAGRAIGGALVLALFFFAMKQRRTIHRRDLLPLLVVVVLSFVWPHSLQPELVARHGGAFVGMTVGFTPLMTILVSIPILGVWPTYRQVLGVAGALVCLALLLIDLRQQSIPFNDVTLAFSVPLSYAIANGVIRRSLRHLPPLELTLISLVGAGSVMLLLSFTISNHRTSNPDQFVSALLAVAILGVLGTGIASFLFNRLVQEQEPLFAAMTTNLIPVGAVIWGIVDGERISAVQMIAVVGILVMVTFVQYASAKPVDVQMPHETCHSSSAESAAVLD